MNEHLVLHACEDNLDKSTELLLKETELCVYNYYSSEDTWNGTLTNLITI